MDLHEKIRTLPTRPGVYLYRNAQGDVIYVGKAKNLSFPGTFVPAGAPQANAKTGSLMREAVDIDYILVENESEALALETNLIKERRPRFNILLSDDKSYPYVKLTLADRFPKVFVTRRLRKDGSAYYGPYFPGNLAHRVVDLIHRSFLLPLQGRPFALPPPALPAVLHQALPGTLRRRNLTTPEDYLAKQCATHRCSWKAGRRNIEIGSAQGAERIWAAALDAPPSDSRGDRLRVTRESPSRDNKAEII